MQRGTEKQGRREIEEELYMLPGPDWEHGESSDQQRKERKDGQKEKVERVEADTVDVRGERREE